MKKSKKVFLDKEIGWLRFNERVLFQASSEDVPLLERVHFSNIFNSNLDEFFMKRVSRMLHRIELARTKDLKASQELEMELHALLEEVRRLNLQNASIVENDLIPQLKEKKVDLLSWVRLTTNEKKWCRQFFKEKVFPVLTPMAVDKGHPFPLISNLTFSLAVELRDPEKKGRLFARIKIPDLFPTWIILPKRKGSPGFRYVSMFDVVKSHLEMLFPDMEIVDVLPFQVTRGLDIKEQEEEDAEDLLELIAEEIKLRRFAEVVRIEVPKNESKWLLRFLKDELGVDDSRVFEEPMPLEYKRLDSIAKLKIAKLRFSRHRPKVPKALLKSDASIFKAIKAADVLVHHPVDSFTESVERFISEAADDPDVVSIKMTLYRAGSKSSIIDALKRASQNGKQVVCLIELKARLDEARNIRWARVLEDAGVHVVYGMLKLKTHAKVVLVVRKERREYKSYAHIGTGNYNPQTAGFYTDLGLFTADSKICAELTEVFHYLTGRSKKKNYKHVLLSPINMKERFLESIANEAKNAQRGLESRIIVKFNNFDDTEIIRALYRASAKGVKIDLIVRGFSGLSPGVPGLSENITVRSIIGRFLEHSRIFCFQDGKKKMEDGNVFLGSADWMRRNLNERVEVVVPVYSATSKAEIARYMELLVSDRIQHWVMNSDGTYSRNFDKNREHIHDLMIKGL
ncbi:polyphosphate kinase 1 [bacterium]|nr:polyphosphate kinase 1 [bacterium]